METKIIKLVDLTKRNSLYQFVCDDVVLGHLRENSMNKYTIFPELPNFKTTTICDTREEGIALMTDKLNQFINKVTQN